MAEVEALVESLWELDEDTLEVQIGSRTQAIGDDLAGRGARGASTDLASIDSIDVGIAARAPIDPKLLALGRRLFDRINPVAHELLCKPLGGEDPDTQKILDETIDKNYTKAASMLAPALIGGLGLAPAVGTLLATLIIKKIARMGSDAICESWEKSLIKSVS